MQPKTRREKKHLTEANKEMIDMVELEEKNSKSINNAVVC